MAQTHTFRGTARSIVRDAGRTIYSYHRTAVVTRYEDGSIRLDSGGWRTATTKTAMNQASYQGQLGFGVHQRDHVWFVTHGGIERPFHDGMTLVPMHSDLARDAA